MPPRKATRHCPPPATLDLRHVRIGKGMYWQARSGEALVTDTCDLHAKRRLLEKLNCDSSLADCYRNHPFDPVLVVLLKPKGYVEPSNLVPIFVTDGE